MEQVGSVIPGLYQEFLLRDLAYICLGAVPVLYAARWGFPGWKDLLDQYPKITVVAFLALSYIGGIAIYHSAVEFEVVYMYPSEPGRSFELQQVEAIANLTRIQKSNGGLVPKYVERIIYLKHMTGAVGLALWLLALLYLLDGFRERRLSVRAWLGRLVFAVLLVSVSVGVLKTNESKAHIQTDVLRELVKPECQSQR